MPIISGLRKGFTIIEILTVITIMAVLLSIGFIAFENAYQKGRDSKRKSDLGDVKTALVSYFNDHESYPHGCSSSCTSPEQYPSNVANWGISGLDSYLKSYPKDPKQAGLFSMLAGLIPKFSGKDSPQTSAFTSHGEVAAATTAKPATVTSMAVRSPCANCVSWSYSATSLNNSDNIYATANLLDATHNMTHWLWGKTFNFTDTDIPPGSTINGITVQVEGKVNIGTLPVIAQLTKGGWVLVGSNSSKTFTTTEQTFTFSNGLWGASWTQSDIKNQGFGVSLYASSTATPQTVSVDSVNASITYTPAAAPTCSGATTTVGVAASVSASSGTAPYTWSAPGGTPSSGSGNTFSVTYSSTGTNTVTVTDSNSLQGTCTVTVNAAPIPPSCSSTSTTSGTPVTLNATSGTPPYTWSAPGGTPSSGTGSSFTVTYTTAVDATYSVTVTDSNSQSGNCTVTVTAPTGPGTPTGCNIDGVIYCYVVSADHLSFALYAKLENDNDIYKMKTADDCSNGGAAPKPNVPAGTKEFNYCLASPK